MKKLLIASAVSAALAAPATALAQQARVPTLGQVLDASGINVNGYIDAAYSWANRDIQNGFTDRVFDSQNNSFALHQFGLTVAKQPKEGFGGLVNFTIGSDAQLIHSFPEFGTGSTFDMTQAYGSYSSGAFTAIAGKFTTLAGSEVIASSGNTTFSRSILFGAIPFTHTGVRASYAPSDTITLYGGLNNGWDQLTDANRQKTLEIGATFNPTKALTLTASGYFGTDPAVPQAGAGPNGERDLIDVVANLIVSNTISLGGEILTFRQDIPGGTTQKYDGVALYFTMMLDPKWRAVVRGEYFDDKQGFHFGTPTGTKYYEGTLCVSYLPTSSVELRTELRLDQANNAVFVDGGSTSKTLATVGLQGLYKF